MGIIIWDGMPEIGPELDCHVLMLQTRDSTGGERNTEGGQGLNTVRDLETWIRPSPKPVRPRQPARATGKASPITSQARGAPQPLLATNQDGNSHFLLTVGFIHFRN
jgi:hypothetical protein